MNCFVVVKFFECCVVVCFVFSTHSFLSITVISKGVKGSGSCCVSTCYYRKGFETEPFTDQQLLISVKMFFFYVVEGLFKLLNDCFVWGSVWGWRV